VAKLTKGAYDPTVGPLVNLWGFGPTERNEFPSDEEINRVKSYVGFEKLKFQNGGSNWLVKKLEPKLYVDLSSSAKGYAVDKLSELLIAEGLVNFLVEVGGEIRAQGKKFEKDWIVAIEKPDPDQRAIYTSFPLKNMSIATSGSYRNFFTSGMKTYSHAIDASTGRPVEHKMLSVTVLNESCMKADAFATALMVLGPEKAKDFAEENDLAVYFIYDQGGSPENPKTSTFSSKAFKALNPMVD
jgi:thiamine biosynthesis lipoprotein